MSEVWNPVPDLVGAYEVSNEGRVRSLSRQVLRRGTYPVRLTGRILKDTKAGKGYRRVSIGGSDRYVHLLVLEAFVGPRPEGMECCHNNGNPADNRLENLRWDTPSSNNRDKDRHGTNPAANRTHCSRGHEFTPENAVLRDGGGRRCRTCTNDKSRQISRVKASTPEGRAERNAHRREWRRRTGRVTGVHNYGSRTHCSKGHEFTPENTVSRPDGGRRCRTCRNELTALQNRRRIEARKTDPEARAKHNAYMREYTRKCKAQSQT